MDSKEYIFSFSKPHDVSFKSDGHASLDYAKQASRSSSMAQRMMTVGALMFTLTVCTSASAMEKEPKLTYTQPDTEAVQQLLLDLQNDNLLIEENKRQNLKIETMALAKLTDNWDDEGAVRVSTTAIKNVLTLLDHPGVRVDLLQDIYANPNGTVSVEWENDSREYAGVQIGRKQMSYYITRHLSSDYCNYEFINEENYQKLLAKLALL